MMMVTGPDIHLVVMFALGVGLVLSYMSFVYVVYGSAVGDGRRGRACRRSSE